MSDSAQLLPGESPRCFQPTVVKALGLEHAILVQQLHHRLTYPDLLLDGVPYVKASYTHLGHIVGAGWSESTLKRHVKGAVSGPGKGYLIQRKDLSQDPADRTCWYTLDYSRLEALVGVAGLLSQHNVKVDPGGVSTCPDVPPKIPDQDILREPVDAPDVQGEDSVSPPPAAAALAVVAPQQQATEGVEATAEPPAMQEEPVQLCGCLWPFAAFVVPSGDAPAPADPDVSVTQHAEPPDPGAPAEPLALPGGEVEAVPVHPTRAASPPQRGAAGLQRASGACQPPAPPECGESYVPLRWLTPQEVGPVLDERGLRAMALGSPTLAARVAAMYQEELAHA